MRILMRIVEIETSFNENSNEIDHSDNLFISFGVREKVCIKLQCIIIAVFNFKAMYY